MKKKISKLKKLNSFQVPHFSKVRSKLSENFRTSFSHDHPVHSTIINFVRKCTVLIESLGSHRKTRINLSAYDCDVPILLIE